MRKRLRTSRLKFSKWFVPVIRKIREGPHSRKELESVKIKQGEESVKIGHASLSRILGALSEADLIREEGGKVWWYEYLQTYKSQEEYEAHLAHSKILFEIVRPVLIEKREPLLKDSKELFECFLEHLKTGYPEEHNLYTKMVSTKPNLRPQVEAQVIRLMLLVESGTPLKGSCKVCPRFHLKKTQV